MNKTQNPKWRPGKNRPAASASLIQGPPLGSFTQESLEKTKPSARPTGSSVDLQRVQHGQFFGANSVASALDLRLERDPEANRSTLSPLHIRTDVNLGLPLHHAVE
jgi:PAB1-binding protein PBP1